MKTPLDEKDIALFWERTGGVFRDFKGKNLAKPLFYLSNEFIGENILDVGAGGGDLVSYLKRKFPNRRFVGMDLVERRERGIIYGSITKIPFPNGEFDTILITDVIEHLTDSQIAKGIKEMKRVLKPGGHIILTTLYEENLKESSVNCIYCKKTFHRYGHYQSFSKHKLRKLFELENFSVEFIKREDFFSLSKTIAESSDKTTLYLHQNYILDSGLFPNLKIVLRKSVYAFKYIINSQIIGLFSQKYFKRTFENELMKERYGPDLLGVFTKK